MIAAPSFAQAAVEEPDVYAFYFPNAMTGIGSAPSQRRDGTTDVMPSAAPLRPWKAGNETATRPWSAPAGHHQPTAIDVLDADSRLTLDQENANIDRIVRGICRGC